MQKIVSSGYSIFYGNESLNFLSRKISASKYSSIFILVDENTNKHCLPQLIINCNSLANAEIIEIDSGETNKNIDICIGMWKTLSEFGANRKSLLINLGGGVITDLGGFVASTFKRGIDFINIPTTLLAMVDASVGGKTGIDLDELKNEIGIFSKPKAVFVFPEFLKTLDKKQIKSGFAELLKHGIIADKKFWNLAKKIDATNIFDLENLILKAIEIKNDIVKKDFNEKNIRKSLNFGHTIGHALESYSILNFKEPLLHGEAVAIGMIGEAFLSQKFAGLSKTESTEIKTIIENIGFNSKLKKININTLIELMKHDKKNENEEIKFSLIKSIGKYHSTISCDKESIIEALKFCNI